MRTEDELTEPGPEITPEQFLAEQKRSIRRKSIWAIGIGTVIVVIHLAGFAVLWLADIVLVDDSGEPLGWTLLFRSIFFILGLLALGAGLWGLYYARKLSLADLFPSEEAIRFLREGMGKRPVYSMAIIACLIGVTIVQLMTEKVDSFLLLGNDSAPLAGLVKPRVWQGEWWRILTSATLHGFFPLHLYFNSQALYGFGTLMEQLSNRAHLPLVFLLSIVGGGFFSLFFMPNITSIGASGGIMGMIGYMAVFGYRRKRQLPPDFLRSMLINIGFIAAFGLIAYRFVDNFAHLGGLLAGALYGLVQIPAGSHTNPRRANLATRVLSVAALAFFAGVCVFTVLKLTGRPTPF
jgi:membrane associated rhomboid family serine protease